MISHRRPASHAVLATVSPVTLALALAPPTFADLLAEPGESATAPAVLPVATIRDIPAHDRLFQRGIPVTPESFSIDGFHYAYLHQIPSGFLGRKRERCAFLLDLPTGENRPVRTPKGRALRVAGWDGTGRYLLIEAEDTDWLSPLTGAWTTYHWIFDVVTSEFVKRRPFTGMRDGQTFRWKHDRTYHGSWGDETDARVYPMYEGELARIYQDRGRSLADEDGRRLALAERLAVGFVNGPIQPLHEVLARLDHHWKKRGHRDPVISDLFGERPTLFQRTHDGGEWRAVRSETEYVAVLDHELALVTGQGGEQILFHAGRNEVLPLPPPPDGWPEELRDRWDREGESWDELDPLPRDLQYRRHWDEGQGIAQYFNYVKADLSQLLVLYSFGPTERVLRVVDLPPRWRPAR